MLLTFLCFAVLDASAKWLVGMAVPAMLVAWFRYFGHFLCTTIVYAPKLGWSIARSNRPVLQSLRALSLLTATVFNFVALQYLPLTTTIAIFFVAPLTVCLLSVPILGEKVGIKRLVAVFIGFVGVLIIVEPWGQRFDPHVLLSFIAMLGASGYFVLSRVIAGADSNATAQFYVSGIAALLLTPAAIFFWQWPPDTQSWVLLILVGLLGMVGHSFLTHAHRFAEASVLAPTVYSQIIYISILSWIVFDEPPDRQTIIGTIIIVASGLFIWFRERQAQTRAQALAQADR